MAEEAGEEENFQNIPLSEGLTSAEAAELLKQHGTNELPDKKKPRWLMFAENLWQPMPIVIWESKPSCTFLEQGRLVLVHKKVSPSDFCFH